jgi:predicted  nucleic acid-binding Zn-ribbon protein
MTATLATSDTDTLRREVSLLRQENQRLHEWQQWQLALLGNAKLPAGQRITALFARLELEQQRTTAAPGQAAPVRMWKIAQESGQSPDVVGRHIKELEAAGAWKREEVRSRDPLTGEVRSQTCLFPLEGYERPLQLTPPKPNNHGGKREKRDTVTCTECGSDSITKTVVVGCTRCGHILEHSQEPVNLSDAPSDVLPEFSTNNQTGGAAGAESLKEPHESTDPQDAARSDQVLAERAAAVLTDIAGDDGWHIRMQSDGPYKYTLYQSGVTDRLALQHLRGDVTIGASLQRADGTTRALCWDADTFDDWKRLKQAAKLLKAAGLRPLLDKSPSREHPGGGCLWLIFDQPIDTAGAFARVYHHAPDLQRIGEYWPRTTRGKPVCVRLPAGFYRRDVGAWCELSDGTSWEQGPAAWKLLVDAPIPSSGLTAENPHESTDPQDAARSEPSSAASARSNGSHQHTDPQDAARRTPAPAPPVWLSNGPDVDSAWHAKYGGASRLWFAITDKQAAAYFNARTSIHDLLTLEANGYALATWRGERNASVKLYGDNTWADFGGDPTRPDRQCDGGDALNLFCRLNNVSRSDALKGIVRDLVLRGVAELEDAARAGREVSSEFAMFVTAAGWRHYSELHNAQPETWHVEQGEKGLWYGVSDRGRRTKGYLVEKGARNAIDELQAVKE